MSTAITAPTRLPAVPWRDPHTVSPVKLAEYIQMLEKACEEDPASADLRTCLGMAQAMNYDVYKSMASLEVAMDLDSDHFFARFKYAELLYRLRALPRAEEETRKAIELANGNWELSMARRQLQEIRRLIREGTQKPAWTKPLTPPVMALLLFVTIVSMVMLWH
jgi:tetratricopeptide (TPR) repeat protein